ncbi:MAG: uracil phosphoribosyltransferase [Cyanobacteria bacterium NC_groundwater_1444_Ag_S-0.65um_54_12]|nr:uracil phosphoribosyltransferase [Cyanobacteria bacterium NC_groundwater_1444_Ag_S-0.65um_54_12]
MTPAVDNLVHILDHPLVHHALAELRHKDTNAQRFRQRARELAKFLILEATRDLQTEPITVETPLGLAEGRTLRDRPIVIAPILRAGLAMVEPAMELLPEAEVRHIGLYRNEATLNPVTYYVRLPNSYPSSTLVLVIDPMLATGGSAVTTIDLFKERGVERIKFLCLIASPQGVRQLRHSHPDVPLFTVTIDDHLDERGYIVPGLGDAGDRTFGMYES